MPSGKGMEPEEYLSLLTITARWVKKEQDEVALEFKAQASVAESTINNKIQYESPGFYDDHVG